MIHTASLINIWILFLAGFATVLTSIVALFAITQSVIGSDIIAKRVLFRNRSRTICKTLNEFGVPLSELRAANRDISQGATRSGEQPSIQHEIDWLSKIAKRFDRDWTRPLELNGITSPPFPAKQLMDLSYAYEEFGKRLRAQVILSSSPLMLEQQQLASTMAKYLKLNGSFRASKFRDPDALRFSFQTPSMTLDLINPRINFSPSYQIDDVGVIHDRRRMVVKNFSNKELMDLEPIHRKGFELDPLKVIELDPPEGIELSPTEYQTLASHFASDRAFDGVLPALHAYHLQLDPFSGHLRLLLEISEISYSAVLATHYVGSKIGAGRTHKQLLEQSNKGDRLLTLSLLPVTSDGYLMAAQRSMHVGVGKLKFAPGVNGNLELRDRLGLKVDTDQFGLPDLLSATVREAKEEIALDIVVNRVQILGLGRFSYEEEVNTWVLITAAVTEHTSDQIVEISKLADQTEGAWELTGNFYRIPIPQDPERAEEIIRWAIHSKTIVPHLVLALLTICLPVLTQDHETPLDDDETNEFWHRRIDHLLSMPTNELPPGVQEIKRR